MLNPRSDYSRVIILECKWLSIMLLLLISRIYYCFTPYSLSWLAGWGANGFIATMGPREETRWNIYASCCCWNRVIPNYLANVESIMKLQNWSGYGVKITWHLLPLAQYLSTVQWPVWKGSTHDHILLLALRDQVRLRSNPWSPGSRHQWGYCVRKRPIASKWDNKVLILLIQIRTASLWNGTLFNFTRIRCIAQFDITLRGNERATLVATCLRSTFQASPGECQ